MNIETVAIPIAFIAASALLLWFIIGSRGQWTLKAICIACTMYFGLAVWHSVSSYLGWPTSQQPPSKFQLHWAIVKEPDKKTDDPGAVYLWLRRIESPDDVHGKPKPLQEKSWLSLLGYRGNTEQPRCYRLPYTRPLHEQLKQAKRQLAQGKPVIGQFSGKGFGVQRPGQAKAQGQRQGSRQGNPAGSAGGGSSYGSGHRNSGEFIFYNLPPPKYPDKPKE